MTILWASRPPAPSAASWSRRASSSSWRWLSGGDVLGEVGATEAWDFNRVRDTTGLTSGGRPDFMKNMKVKNIGEATGAG